MKAKKITFAVLFLIIAIVSCFAIGCSDGTDYCGTYKSIFVDSQNDDDSISFTLTINKDKSFELSKSPQNASYKGTWRSYTESDKKQLLCCIEEGYKWNSSHPNVWNPYFSLCFLDDGTLMATPGSTFSSMSSSSAFGSGQITAITLVLFERS